MPGWDFILTFKRETGASVLFFPLEIGALIVRVLQASVSEIKSYLLSSHMKTA